MTDEEIAQLREALERVNEAATDFLVALRSAAKGFADALDVVETSDGPVKFGRGYPESRYPEGYGIDV